jgi:uncharacterized protein (DUF2141 family)
MTTLLKILFLFSILLLSNSAFSLELIVEVKKIKQFDKKIIIELFQLKNQQNLSWQDIKLLQKKIIKLNTEDQVIKFSQLEEATYAIRLYQDINSNNILDKSSNNIPLEPVGFSTNPSLFKGEPFPDNCAIQLKKDKHILINIKHRKPKRKRKKRQ